MYLNLLKKAMDKETEDVAHPAFAKIIGLLSPDEVFILHLLGQRTFEKHVSEGNARIILQEFPVNDLAYPNNFDTYISHLSSLILIDFSGRARNDLYIFRLQLTDFGRMFVTACQPGEKL